MKFVKGFLACFSTYSRIPMPKVELNSDDMKYSLMFFPLIGVVIGALQYVLFRCCHIFDIPRFVYAILSTVLVVVVTGGIHIDGFMDTCDALGSYGDREKKLAIMKDPNTGAFAVINLMVYELIFIAGAYMLNEKGIMLFSIGFALSRSFSGIAACNLKNARDNGMLYSINKVLEKRTVTIFLSAFIIALGIMMVYINLYFGSFLLLFLVLFFFYYRNKFYRELNGVTGDTAGWYLCVMELIIVITSAAAGIL